MSLPDQKHAMTPSLWLHAANKKGIAASTDDEEEAVKEEFSLKPYAE